jgi:glycerol-3-phosphate acyltransferase PlsY
VKFRGLWSAGMTLTLDPVTVVNFLLGLIILLLGIFEYKKSSDTVVLLIGTAFGLFAFSHLLTLLGYAAALDWFIIVIRIIAYLVVIYAILVIVRKNRETSPEKGK